jgi:hypothetical protein
MAVGGPKAAHRTEDRRIRRRVESVYSWVAPTGDGHAHRLRIPAKRITDLFRRAPPRARRPFGLG